MKEIRLPNRNNSSDYRQNSFSIVKLKYTYVKTMNFGMSEFEFFLPVLTECRRRSINVRELMSFFASLMQLVKQQ